MMRFHPASSTDFVGKNQKSGVTMGQNQYPSGSTDKVAAKRLDGSTQVETTLSFNMAVTACCCTIVAGEILLPKILRSSGQKGIRSHKARGRCSLLNVAAATVVSTRVQNCATCEQIGQSQVVSIICRAISYMGEGPHFRTVMV
jgi:hypothetical protein